MATNGSLTLSSLDFDTLKTNFKEFLKAQTAFKDYDFDGSNINVLLDVMTYNSYLNAFYLNMISSEMFLDSAQKYESVISHAKELNYVPRSRKSSSYEISVDFTTSGIPGKFTIPKGTLFSAFNANGSFVFTTNEPKVLSTTSNVILQVYEGDYHTDTHVVDYNIENQRFIISDKNIDTSSLTLYVSEDNGSSNVEFLRSENLFGLTGQSNVYFLQSSFDQGYEIVFGDNLFGRKPKNGAVLNLNYRIPISSNTEGISAFALSSDLGPINGGQVVADSITILSSTSGSEKETIESVRLTAPRYFATQQRAISSDDYSTLILDNFSGEISDVAVYGGQEVEPKLYGRVIVGLKPTAGTIVPDYVKAKITKYLEEYIALPNRIVITNPEYTYCRVFSEVQYDPKITTKTASEIRSEVINSIVNYSANNLETFGNDLRYSKLIATIDSSDESVTSNDTELRIIKRINPNLNEKTSYNISVGNVLYYDATSLFSTNAEHKLLHDSEIDLRYTHATLISSTFTYNSTSGTVYSQAFFEDDTEGNIKVYAPVGAEYVPIETVGTINYLTGQVTLTNINIADYTEYISLYFRSRFKDIYASQNKIIVIDPRDVTVSVIEKQQ